MKIIIVNGVASSGKDKFVSFFKDISNGDLRVKNYSSIDRVKQIAEICFNWNGKKNDKSRRLLSEMKRVWTNYNDGPFNVINDKILTDLKHSEDKGKDTSVNIYFLHVREPDEILKVKKFYGEQDCVTLLIRKDVDFIPNNNSDKNVENFEYDYVVDNNKSEEELKIRAKEFLNYLLTFS